LPYWAIGNNGSDHHYRDGLGHNSPRQRRLIRAGFEQGIPGEQLAQAAGLSMSRVYQIRDGRR
jgi:hypothetical protein